MPLLQLWRKIEASGEPAITRNKHSAQVFRDRLYIFGGYSLHTRQFYNDVMAFDFTDQVWETVVCKGRPPCPRRAHTCVLIGSELVIFGGYNGEDCLNDTFTLQLPGHQWERRDCVGEMPCSRGGHTAVTWNKTKMVIHGGWDVGAVYFDSTYVLDTACEPWKWHKLPIGENALRPQGRVGHTSGMYEDRHMMVFGGYGAEGYWNDLHRLDLLTNQWTKIETTGVSPSQRTFCTMESVGQQLLMFGGSNHDFEMNDVYVLHAAENRWEKMACVGQVPEGRFAHTSCVYDHRIYVYGGIVRDNSDYGGLFELTLESFVTDCSLRSLAIAWLVQNEVSHYVNDASGLPQIVIERLDKYRLAVNKMVELSSAAPITAGEGSGSAVAQPPHSHSSHDLVPTTSTPTIPELNLPIDYGLVADEMGEEVGDGADFFYTTSLPSLTGEGDDNDDDDTEVTTLTTEFGEAEGEDFFYPFPGESEGWLSTAEMQNQAATHNPADPLPPTPLALPSAKESGSGSSSTSSSSTSHDQAHSTSSLAGSTIEEMKATSEFLLDSSRRPAGVPAPGPFLMDAHGNQYCDVFYFTDDEDCDEENEDSFAGECAHYSSRTEPSVGPNPEPMVSVQGSAEAQRLAPSCQFELSSTLLTELDLVTSDGGALPQCQDASIPTAPNFIGEGAQRTDLASSDPQSLNIPLPAIAAATSPSTTAVSPRALDSIVSLEQVEILTDGQSPSRGAQPVAGHASTTTPTRSSPPLRPAPPNSSPPAPISLSQIAPLGVDPGALSPTTTSQQPLASPPPPPPHCGAFSTPPLPSALGAMAHSPSHPIATSESNSSLLSAARPSCVPNQSSGAGTVPQTPLCS